LIWPLELVGQPDSISTVERSLPVLNNLYFIPNSNFPSPFITSSFKAGVGSGVTLNTIPIYSNDGKQLLGSLEGRNSYIIADIEVRVKAKEWLAVWFRYQAIARIGSSTPTILAHGVTSITGFEFGWMLRLWHSRKSQLSTTLAINNSTVNAVNISGFIKDVITRSDSIYTPLSKKENPLDGQVGFHYAYSFSDLAGIQAFINTSYGESLTKDNRNVWNFDTGILGSFNFLRNNNIPLGINLGYTIKKFALFESQNDDKIKTFIFKLAYTGREEFNIGLEFTYVSTAVPLIKVDNSLNYMTISFVMVYYF
jgi:hypothetical protein